MPLPSHSQVSVSSSSSSPAIPVGALSVMVARFADSNRQQTVILHPRPISSSTRTNVINSSSINTLNAPNIRSSTVIAGQNLSNASTTTSSSTPVLTSSSTSISVRTTHLIGGQQHSASNAVPVLNLSNTHTTSANVKQQICTPRPFMTTSGALPIESVSLVVANTNDSNAVMNARPIRLHHSNANTSEIKQNAAPNVHNINKISAVPRTSLMTASTIVAANPTKMISISGTQSSATVPQHVARVGIIGQLPTAGGIAAANKSGIINLATASLPKGFIFNSSPTVSTTLHNMVNVSGSVASFTTQPPSTTKLSVNQTANNITRHSVVSSASFVQQNVANLSHPQPLHRSVVQNANINSLQTSQQSQHLLQPPSTTSAASPLKPNILSSPASSPIKQHLQQNSTPSSPRPSILIRKRVANDSQSSVTPTALFKTSTPTTATSVSTPSTPQKLTNAALNSTSELNAQTSSQESRDSDAYQTGGTRPLQPNLTATPSTPNSDGNQTPRKKPRKQLLEPLSLKSSQSIQLLNSSHSDSKSIKEDVCNDRDSTVEANKKPRFSLLSHYNMQWKSLQYHFLRYSDVRPKPEKKLTLSELSNEGLRKKNGWKIHHLATQMEVMSDNEQNIHERLKQFLESFEKDYECTTATTCSAINAINSCELNKSIAGGDLSSFDINSITIKLNDLIKGNLQRSNLFSDQINEARQLVIKLTNDHKERVAKITKKCANKRTYITK